ncbi:MAG: hypothetical protein PHT29_05730 [Eubacteriales bacterium]|nr:hypothetical protein [Eubacteriales bacterium]
MKRSLSALLFVFLVALLVACSGSPAAPDAASEPDADAASAIGQEAYAPQDLFGKEFDPFYDVNFPGSFHTYAAYFIKGSNKFEGKTPYILSMTASGKAEEAIAFLIELAGKGEDERVSHTEDYNNGGFCEFQSEDGTVFIIRQTDLNDDRYAYVDGCHIDLWTNITGVDVSRYTRLISDNFNVNALATAADHFDITPVFDKCDIEVNLHKKSARVTTHYTVQDAEAVEQHMAGSIQNGWYDAQSGKMGFSYGTIYMEYLFDVEAGSIYVSEATSELTSPLSAYVEPEVSLTKLGFGFEQEGICGVYEDREPYYRSVAIHRPEWGEFSEDWNMEYLDQVNGYGLRITYSAADDLYRVSADKNNTSAIFHYSHATGNYEPVYPDPDTIRQRFNEAFGTQGDDFVGKPLELFEQFLQEKFGMGFEKVYALPIK